MLLCPILEAFNMNVSSNSTLSQTILLVEDFCNAVSILFLFVLVVFRKLYFLTRIQPYVISGSSLKNSVLQIQMLFTE